MKRSVAFFIIIIIFISGILYFFWEKGVKKRRKKLAEKLIREENERKTTFAFLKLRIVKISVANNRYEDQLKHEAGYFSNYKMTIWKEEYTSLFNEIKDKSFESINLADEEVENIKSFINYYKNCSAIRTDFNKTFIASELKQYEDFFLKIENHGLDKEQRIAIVADDDNNIVIAGAGSGKTTTIVGKVNYIIDRYKIPPSEILLISFTTKSASILAERINIHGIEAKTFHKFGKDVICEVEKKQPSIFDEKQFKPILINCFEKLVNDRNYLQKVTTYFNGFLKPEKSQDDFENQGAYIQYLKDQNFKSYKTKKISYKGKMTYKMEIVKSIEECKIANFLLFNSVDYEYELPYKYNTATIAYRQYKPDFTINPKSDAVYLEHFGINKKGEVPAFFAKTDEGQTIQDATKEYTDGIKWKQNLHKANQTVLIETYSHEMLDGVLFENLERRLVNAGVQLHPKSPEEIWKIISDVAKEEVDNFILLF
jgi:DNA helicase IV